MTPRPPTLRENRRYILARIEPAGTAVEPKELYYAIADAVTSLWGDAVAGVIVQAVMSIENGHAIIRCLRGTERELTIALSTVTLCRDTRIALRIVAASGTIESLRDRIREGGNTAEPVPDNPAAVFDRKETAIVYCNGQKVDVTGKGFKNAHRLFVTRSELENG